jgi:maltose O-acetyltransferase
MSDSLNSITTDRKRFADRPRRLFWRFRQFIMRDLLINGLCGSIMVPQGFRRAAARAWGADIDATCRFRQGNRFDSNLVSFGENTWVAECAFRNPGAGVTLERHVCVGFGSTFITRTHPIGPSDLRCGHETPGIDLPIVVGEGSWLGAGVTVLPGVTIGNGCVIAAGAVVDKDCEPNGLYGGVPARRLRELD